MAVSVPGEICFWVLAVSFEVLFVGKASVTLEVFPVSVKGYKICVNDVLKTFLNFEKCLARTCHQWLGNVSVRNFR